MTAFDGEVEENGAAVPIAEDWRPSSAAISFITDVYWKQTSGRRSFAHQILYLLMGAPCVSRFWLSGSSSCERESGRQALAAPRTVERVPRRRLREVGVRKRLHPQRSFRVRVDGSGDTPRRDRAMRRRVSAFVQAPIWHRASRPAL